MEDSNSSATVAPVRLINAAKPGLKLSQPGQKEIELQPIRETPEDYDRLERALIVWFRAEIYAPVMKLVAGRSARLENAKDSPLVEALKTGKVQFARGTFSGKFNAQISKELRDQGARWDRKTSTWKLPLTETKPEIRAAIDAGEARFKRVLASIDQKLTQILPAEIADRLSVSSIFDSSLGKMERSFRQTVKGITVAPELTDEMRKRLSEEWQANMRLWIKDFTEEEISKLRKDLQAKAFAGNRYESAVKTIQKSYGVSLRKAKFLARQETSLLMSTFQETRYLDAGIYEYRWGCVKMPHDKSPGDHVKGNVRYSHGLLENKIFRWDNPPITSEPGQPVRRNNPGRDYECRCFAIPIVRF